MQHMAAHARTQRELGTLRVAQQGFNTRKRSGLYDRRPRGTKTCSMCRKECFQLPRNLQSQSGSLPNTNNGDLFMTKSQASLGADSRKCQFCTKVAEQQKLAADKASSCARVGVGGRQRRHRNHEQ
eukprot:Tamp_23206.p1 GENE.Tamp_23206~~Tamp_23206.p1  ORF type:complete len:145 (-),score=12.56 Tamp_23206:612-989(-)